MKIERKRYGLASLENSQSKNFRTREAVILTAALLPIILLWGCAGIVSGQKTANTTATQTYSISGAITPAASGSGATITLSGAASATTTANGSGTFTFTGLADGTYTLTPSHAGYTFSPIEFERNDQRRQCHHRIEFYRQLRKRTASRGRLVRLQAGAGRR